MATWDARDTLLLAFTEIDGYGVLTAAGAAGTAAAVAAMLTGTLQVMAPHGMGSYAFWLASDEHRFAGGGLPPVYTSGPDVDRALAAALRHQGYEVGERAA
jgi:hypothetical protein